MFKITATTKVVREGLQVTMVCVADSPDLSNIFLHAIEDDGSLGEYQGVCNYDELSQRKVWEANPLLPRQNRSLGTRYKRFNRAVRVLGSATDVASFLSHTRKVCTDLREQIETRDNATTIMEI